MKTTGLSYIEIFGTEKTKGLHRYDASLWFKT